MVEASWEVFEKALHLDDNWEITDVDFNTNKYNQTEIHIDLKIKDNLTFKCEEDGCDEVCQVHDMNDIRWLYSGFFQYKTYLYARVPVIKCSKHGEHIINVPWNKIDNGQLMILE